jgi:hypothetical protein
MKKFVVMMAMVGSVSAQAATFVCESEDGIRIRANDSVMVVSDTSVQSGRKTIARFTEENGTLTVKDLGEAGPKFIGKVDLRFNDSERAGEYLFGTRLGEIRALELYPNYTEDSDGEGVVTIKLRNGTRRAVNLLCAW